MGKYLKDGFTEVLAKPFTEDDLLRAIQTHSPQNTSVSHRDSQQPEMPIPPVVRSTAGVEPVVDQDVLERLLEGVSFEASDRSGDKVVIDQAFVNEHLDELAEDEDYARYIL